MTKLCTLLDYRIKQVMPRVTTEMIHLLNSLPIGEYAITTEAYHGIVTHPSFKLDWMAKMDKQNGYDITDAITNACGMVVSLEGHWGDCFKEVDGVHRTFTMANGTRIITL